MSRVVQLQRVYRSYALAAQSPAQYEDHTVSTVGSWYPTIDLVLEHEREIIEDPENEPDVVWVIAEQTTVILEMPSLDNADKPRADLNGDQK